MSEDKNHYLDEVRANLAELHLKATEAGSGFRGIATGTYGIEDPCGYLEVVVRDDSILTLIMQEFPGGHTVTRMVRSKPDQPTFLERLKTVVWARQGEAA